VAKDENVKTHEKWDFSDYAFTITGILVGILLIVPEILEAQFGISILGGSLRDFAEDLEYGRVSEWDFNRLRALSPMLFLLTTTIVFFKDAIDARKTGGYTGSLFTYTFEDLFEDAIYMAITTIMVYSAIFADAMYISWLAGPITWILFVFLFPVVKKKDDSSEEDAPPWLLLLIFAGGIAAEIITRAWIAFPLSWLIICAVKCISAIREGNYSSNTVFSILYYAFSVILMTVGIILNFWIASWIAFPTALFICWILSKFGLYKKTNPRGQ